MCLERYARKVGLKNRQKTRKKDIELQILYVLNYSTKVDYDLLKKSVKIAFFIPLVSSQWSCLLNEPKRASIFHAIESFKSLM
jgi:hypothetical protein